jgi:isocitrate dehydrogenase
LAFRGKLDDNKELINFANSLEQVCIETVESGQMTKDLALIIHGKNLTEDQYLTTEQFLEALDENLQKKLN